MPVCVTSEIGSLKRVLLQRPGRELEHLSPNTMEQLLFDDIPYLYGAQQEHDCFAEILRGCGAGGRLSGGSDGGCAAAAAGAARAVHP